MTKRLAPLRLADTGTELVESVPSYVLRLAHTHGVSPLRVQRLIFSMRCADEIGPAVKFGALSFPALAGYSDATRTYLRRLEELTGQQILACGSLVKLAPMLAPNGTGAILGRLRWCPECFASGSPDCPERLIWQLKTAHVCPRDGCPLLIACPRCGSARASLRDIERRTKCHKCGHDLRESESRRRPLGHFHMWEQKQTEDLIRLVADTEWAGVGKDALKVVTNALAGETKRERRSRTEQMPTVTRLLERIRKRGARPQLTTVFLATAELGMAPRAVFESPLLVTQSRLINSVPQGRPQLAVRRVPRESKERLREALIQMMAVPGSLPPPFRQLCCAAGMRASTFFQFDPDVYRQYGEYRKRELQDARQERTSRALWTAVLLELARQHEAGSELNLRQMGAEISSVTGATKAEAESVGHVAKLLIAALGDRLMPTITDSVRFRNG